MVNKDNFYKATKANFTICKKPSRKPDYESQYSCSKYWYTKEGVIRESDHWNENIITCSWLINGKRFAHTKKGYVFVKPVDFTKEENQINAEKFWEKTDLTKVCGFCKWEDFEEKVVD